MVGIGRRARSLVVVLVVLVVAVGLSGCQIGKVGRRCNGGFGRDNTHVLVCRNGRWARMMTFRDYLLLVQRLNQTPAVEGTPDERPPDVPLTSPPTGPTTSPVRTNPPTPDPAPLPDIASTVSLLTGTTSSLTVVTPGLAAATSATSAVTGSGVTIATSAGGVGTDGAPGVVVDVTAALTEPGNRNALVQVNGCRNAALPCPSASQASVKVLVTIIVTAPSAQVPNDFPGVSEQRWSPTGDGQAVLPDEATIFAEPAVTAAQIAALVTGLGGGLTGAGQELDAYQARFGNLAAALVALNASPLVKYAEQTIGQPIGLNADPVDWRGDDGEAQKWTFTQTRAVDAWDITTGSNDVHLGVVDYGIYPDHADLSPLASYDHPFNSNKYDIWTANQNTPHGTHVAGTMCLPDGNGGLVGVSQRCKLHALDLTNGADTFNGTDPDRRFESYVRPVQKITRWLVEHPEIKVVNMSFALIGAHQDNRCSKTVTPGEREWFRDVFSGPVYRNRLIVTSAGNCGESNGAYKSANDKLPSAAHDLPNVIAVSATQYRGTGPTTRLAKYSATDGDIAAPGGSDSKPVWSTTYKDCSPTVRSCTSTWSGAGWQGTSMAAPFVAGTAGLMLAANPTLTGAQLKTCLTTQANATDVAASETNRPPAYGLREVDVDLAVRCAQPNALRISTPSPPAYSVGDQVDFQLTATGGTAPYSFGITSAIPTDWPDSSFINGRLRGRIGPTTTTIEFIVTDAVGLRSTRSYTFGLAPPLPLTATVTRTSGQAGYSTRISNAACPATPTGFETWLVVKSLTTGSSTAISPPRTINFGTPVWGNSPGYVTYRSEVVKVSCRLVSLSSTDSDAVWTAPDVAALEFTRSFTGPTTTVSVNPTAARVGDTITITDGGGCGPYPGHTQSAHLEIVLNIWWSSSSGWNSHTLADLGTVPVDVAGRWGPVQVTVPPLDWPGVPSLGGVWVGASCFADDGTRVTQFMDEFDPIT